MAAFDSTAFFETAVGIPSNEDVDEMRSLLCETLHENGVEPGVDSAGNVVATRAADGSDDGPHLVFNTHLDTVSPHVPPARDGDVLRGRGACDAKGPLAAMLAAFLGHEPDHGRVTLAVTPDEETYSTGAATLAAALDLDAERGDAVVVGEPTGLSVCIAAKGRFEGTLEICGESAHAAEPESGKNAIVRAARVVEVLSGFDDRPNGTSAHADLGAPTLTPTVITGGEATNQVPGDCELVLDRRSVPPETAEGFAAAFETHLREHLDFGEFEFRFTERDTPFLDAFETPADSRVVRAFRESGCGVESFAAATEASYFARRVPTVVFGPGELADEEGPVAHADREYVRFSAVERAVETLRNVLSEHLRENHV